MDNAICYLVFLCFVCVIVECLLQLMFALGFRLGSIWSAQGQQTVGAGRAPSKWQERC